MKFRVILPIATGLLAAACASTDMATPHDPGPAAPGVPTASAPAPIPNYDWHLNRHENEVSLAYGVADSDDVRLSLHCLAGVRTVTLHKDVEDGAPSVIHLESGGETERFPAQGEESLLTGGVILTAEADADHPVFQRFRRLGWVASWVGERREPYAAHPGSETAVEGFFSACG